MIEVLLLGYLSAVDQPDVKLIKQALLNLDTPLISNRLITKLTEKVGTSNAGF